MDDVYDIIGPYFEMTSDFDIAVGWLNDGHGCAIFKNGHFVGPMVFAGETPVAKLWSLDESVPYGTVYRCKCPSGKYDYYVHTQDWILCGLDHPVEIIADGGPGAYGNYALFERDGTITVRLGNIGGNDGIVVAERCVYQDRTEQVLNDMSFMNLLVKFYSWVRDSEYEVGCEYLQELSDKVSEITGIDWSVVK